MWERKATVAWVKVVEAGWCLRAVVMVEEKEALSDGDAVTCASSAQQHTLAFPAIFLALTRLGMD